MTVILDIESNGLLLDVTTIFCIALKVDDEDTKVYTSRPIKGSSGSIEDAILIASKADTIIGHNIIKYDLPVIKKLYNKQLFDTNKVYDTLLVSKLCYPNRLDLDLAKYPTLGKQLGSHSLKAWGKRLGNYKESFDDWTKLSEEMVEYCRQDVEVTYTLYKHLLTKNTPIEAIRLENSFAHIIGRQEAYGVYFDIKKAESLHIELLREKDIMEMKLKSIFTPLLLPTGHIKTQANYKKPFPLKVNNRGMVYGDYQDIELVEFNPASRQHIVTWFKRWYGWEPTQMTDKGTAIVDEGVLKDLPFEEAKVLTHYFNVNKLLGQVAVGDNAWLKLVRREDGRIHGSVDTLGAVSRRCTHNKPNMAQVPSARAFKGKECRELFTVPKGKKLVGCDADGLELRTLSHYMARFDDGAYAYAVDEGKKEDGTDIHTLNQKAAGLATRDESKTFIYAFLYGAGDEKIGSIVGGTEKEGKKLKNTFFTKIPAIKTLIEAVKGTVKTRGSINAIDGNPYFIRSPHSALNTLLQGCGALVMKYWLVELDRELEKVYTNSSTSNTPDYEFVLNIHDEAQIECNEDIAEDVLAKAVSCFDTVTDKLKFRIPLRGSGSIGNNWYDTH